MSISYYLAEQVLLQSPVSELTAEGSATGLFRLDGAIELSQGAGLIAARPVDAQGRETGEPLALTPLDKIVKLRAVSTQALGRGTVLQERRGETKLTVRRPFLTKTELERLAVPLLTRKAS